MSTSYYRLKYPVTDIHLESGGSHSVLHVWIDHGLAGDLVIRNEHLRATLWLFRSDKLAFHTHYGGPIEGSIVHEEGEALPGYIHVISEYGDVLTAAQVRNRAGAKRKDGMPTELFGYED